ncbi:hypothetical protein HBI56_057950 [Parastagonospora nodorum]|nr:hypothetical protein HBH56_094190 [Parastagonospora nodorum]KAH3930602.1 hypothetical protein HBH54_108510 [Parastagonospora nodorum]KAH4003240.1 hypothetical protein HBI10_070930 [Parastagonospora nodorum]KAH4027872.1 hypothetical protein HBI13_047090 [Parastagonospora nodorum]KAH4050592.1 hypothetical protein HBH49_120600 [Parastagonospora nodorum]
MDDPNMTKRPGNRPTSLIACVEKRSWWSSSARLCPLMFRAYPLSRGCIYLRKAAFGKMSVQAGNSRHHRRTSEPSEMIRSKNFQFSKVNMKSFATILILISAASAATLKPRAECHAKKHESCAFIGQRGCEHNGGHVMECRYGLRLGNIWFKGENCAEKNAHCDCATGSCVPN